jgi:signal transduction histidine kinase
VEAGRLTFQPRTVDLERVVQTTVEELRSLADENHLELCVEVNLKQSQAFNDPKRLRQILMNLVSNAIKFTNQGSVLVSVSDPSEDTVLITVKDTGIGIASEDLNYIFEAFRQLDQSRTRKRPGTGLGLAITNSLVRMMDGSIQVESEVEQGTAFIVQLPRYVSQPDDRVPSATAL